MSFVTKLSASVGNFLLGKAIRKNLMHKQMNRQLRKSELIRTDLIKTHGSNDICETKLDELCSSIRIVGLLQPVVVSEDITLIAGRHRLAAFQKLEIPEIPCRIVKLNGAERMLAEIDENLIRKNLTVLEFCLALKCRKELYESLNPETIRGKYRRHVVGPKTLQASKDGFAKEISADSNTSSRTIHRLLKIANSLDHKAVSLIRRHPIANKKTELTRLSSLSESVQRKVASALITQELKSVNDAINSIHLSEADKQFITTQSRPKKIRQGTRMDSFDLKVQAKALRSFLAESTKCDAKMWNELAVSKKDQLIDLTEIVIEIFTFYQSLFPGLFPNVKLSSKNSRRLLEKPTILTDKILPLFEQEAIG